ncbi:MAG: 50S ribosomal protein L25 [Syntrophales bacterium]|nr:50S ribosomal protein L25 [Syntrophales bacterium]MDD5641627.1 50S ribosomal protein L25 [Syntrophales bacterium]
MEKIVIQATKREVTGKKVGALRRAGQLPAVLYGHNIDTVPIMLDARTATQLLAHLTSSSLVTVDLEGKEFLTLVREKQRDYLKNTLLHVDFNVVSLTEKMHVKVGIEITGTAPAVKDFNAMITHVLSEVEVECLPQDLPERFQVDISGLAAIGDRVCVQDIAASDQVKILADPEEIIAVASAPTKEAVVGEAPAEEGEAAPEAAAAAEPEKD